MKGDPSREAFGALLQKIRSRAAEDQEPRAAGSVGQDPESREQVGPTLDLVQDDETAEAAQREERIAEASDVRLALEVEERHGTLGRRRDLAGERRLSDLPGPEEAHDTEAAEESPDAGDVGGPLHERTLP